MTICDYPGCTNEGNQLEYPDGSPAYVCDDHMRVVGFCAGCGGFYGGVESFSFIEPIGLCDDCKNIDHDPFDYEEWEDWIEWAESERLNDSDADPR